MLTAQLEDRQSCYVGDARKTGRSWTVDHLPHVLSGGVVVHVEQGGTDRTSGRWSYRAPS
eukprot:3751013-Prymnesium_polylepis.1